jgi:catechol 2,3-dioxygenase
MNTIEDYLDVYKHLDGNGVELYCDRPQEQWPRGADGEFTMFTAPLDLRRLLAEAG